MHLSAFVSGWRLLMRFSCLLALRFVHTVGSGCLLRPVTVEQIAIDGRKRGEFADRRGVFARRVEDAWVTHRSLPLVGACLGSGGSGARNALKASPSYEENGLIVEIK